MSRSFSDTPASLIDAVVALCLAGVGAEHQRRAIAEVLERGGTPDAGELILRLLAGVDDAPSPQAVARARSRLRALGLEVLIPGCRAYPRRLLDAWPELGAPLWLFASTSAPAASAASGRTVADRPANDDEHDDAPAVVAVVGTRRPTATGLHVAEMLSAALAGAGAWVVSGMARGIDQAAHRGALQAGGCTVAVLGTGHGVDYPRGSEAVRNAVGRSGGLLSELLPGTPPRPQHFLARNRIISGLADATVVVEGRTRSGALQTARLAAAQGRDVWAVPGAIVAPASQAPLALIRDGAAVLTRVEDLLSTLGLVGGPGREPESEDGGAQRLPLDDATTALLDLLGTEATSVDELVRRSGQSAARVMTLVHRLQRAGLAEAGVDGIVASLHRPARRSRSR